MSDLGAKLIADAIESVGWVYLLVSLTRFIFGGDKR